MSRILKKQPSKKNKEDKFLGITIAEEISSYLSLFCLATNSTKVDVVRPLVLDWFLGHSNDPMYMSNTLISEVVERINTQWSENPTNWENIGEFKHQLRKELTSKGICKTHINRILNGIDKANS